MAKPRSRSTIEDGEMPSLANSDTSRSGCNTPPDGVADYDDEEGLHSDFSSHYSSDRPTSNNGDHDHDDDYGDGDGDVPIRKRHTADDSINDSSASGSRQSSAARSASTSPPPPPPPRRRRTISPPLPPRRRTPASPPRKPRSRSRPRQQHHQPPPTRSPQQPPPPPPSSSSRAASQGRRRRRRNNKSSSSRPPSSRFSYSRRSSLGGTTVYQSHHVALLDAHLRSTSGLRLQADGTCQFLFDDQRFAIETADEGDGAAGGDFLFYASFGTLKELQKENKGRNLLKMLASWNEELKTRAAEEENDSGLLRIDSSKQEGPHVAFIHYGRMEEIRDAVHFQETLDDFVDDALEFSDMLHHFDYNEVINKEKLKDNESGDVPVPPPVPSLGGKISGNKVQHNHGREMWGKSSQNKVHPGSSCSTIRGESSSSSSTHQQPSNNNSDHSSSSRSKLFNKDHPTTPKEAATPDASAETSTPGAITSTDVYHANTKKSVFSKMIQSIRSKSNAENIGAHAFVDPNNPGSAFVVNKMSPPCITLSRSDSSMAKNNKASSFHNRSGDEGKRDHYRNPQKGRSFHLGDDVPQKGRSFHLGDDINYNNTDTSSSRRNRQHKSSSFYTDDHPGRSHRSSSRQHRSTSLHVDDGHYPHRSNNNNNNNKPSANSRAKSKSFHNHNGGGGGSKRNSQLTEDSSDYERSNQSIDILNNSSNHPPGAGGMMHQSEPAAAGMMNQQQQGYPGDPPSRPHGHSSSRRHSTVTSGSSRHHHGRISKRHSAHDEAGGGGRGRRHRSKSRSRVNRMNQSEPILSQPR